MKQLIRNILKEEKESFYKKVADILDLPYFENLQKMSITDEYEIKKILEYKFNHPIKIRNSPPTFGLVGEIIDYAVGWVEYDGNNPNLYHPYSIDSSSIISKSGSNPNITDINSLGRKFGKVLYSEEDDWWGFMEYNDDGELTNEWDVGGGW